MAQAIAPLTDVSTWARSSGLEIILYITGALLLARFIRWAGALIGGRIDARARAGQELVRSETAKHAQAVVQVTMWMLIVLVYCAAAVLSLQRLGVPLTSLVAPAAVVGVALGFGAQRLVQDLLSGVFIIAERQYGYGDVIRISALGSETGVSGTVEEVTPRITRLRTLNGEVVIVPNGQIVQVTNQSRDWARVVIDVPVPTTADVGQVREILADVGNSARVDSDLGPLLLDVPSVLGVESIELDVLHVRMVARTLPGRQFEVGRDLRARLAVALQHRGITVATSVQATEPTADTSTEPAAAATAEPATTAETPATTAETPEAAGQARST